MMLVLGFPLQWISWIMKCVTTVSYSIIINGEPKGFFRPSRGLRQGCPLSPYLFLFCTEGFSNILNRANLEECDVFIEILWLYGNASGQLINLEKSSLFFSSNIPTDLCSVLADKLQVGSVGLQDKYLGLPSLISRSKAQIFSDIRNKVWRGLLTARNALNLGMCWRVGTGGMISIREDP
ncbi:uncharacterized protein LOC126664387 [Mercurialis annua]|uniref:uncharacterized protein LOC126664387 n=1 Tax=Mercurialis annua TaxID=3986 RepID=UPI002160D424|nr:uncharacterized protein LOC126664387 [Mercurialis annua]